MNIQNIQVQYRGRPVNLAGERTFQPWTISIYNDTSFGIRNALEVWSNGIQRFNSTEGITKPTDYQVDLLVDQLDRNGAIIKTYKFVDSYPSDIGAIQLDYELGNQLEIFDVTFIYNYYDSNTNSGDSGFGVNVSVSTPLGTITT